MLNRVLIHQKHNQGDLYTCVSTMSATRITECIYQGDTWRLVFDNGYAVLMTVPEFDAMGAPCVNDYLVNGRVFIPAADFAREFTPVPKAPAPFSREFAD